MSPKKISLLTMPEDVMTIILEKCDFLSIIVLRKTCKGLRNFIDDTKPEQSISQIGITSHCNLIELNLVCGEQETKILYRYSKTNRIRDVKQVVGSDFEKRFLVDFESLLKFRLSILNKFFINGGQATFFKELGGVLQRSNIQTKMVRFNGIDDFGILQILPNIRLESLKNIEIRGNLYLKKSMDIAKLAELEQWKQSKEFECIGFSRIPAPFQNFENFERVVVNEVASVSMDSLKLMKNIFLNSTSSSKNFKFHSERNPMQNEIIQEFGPPGIVINNYENESLHWFFKKPDNHERAIEMILKSEFDDDDDLYGSILEFDIIPIANVPDGVLVVD